MKAFSLVSGKEQGCPLLPFLFNTVWEILNTAIRKKKFFKSKLERTRWQRSRWMWSTSPSTDTSRIHLQTQKCMKKTSTELQSRTPPRVLL